jgi:hypothetical protein
MLNSPLGANFYPWMGVKWDPRGEEGLLVSIHPYGPKFTPRGFKTDLWILLNVLQV